MARAVSGSTSSIISVEPLMSANSAVMVLRSPSAGAESTLALIRTPARSGRGALWEMPFGASIVVEHCAQNFARGGFSAPHDGHLRANGAAHSIQNLALSGFSTPHFEQYTRLSKEEFASNRSNYLTDRIDKQIACNLTE